MRDTVVTRVPLKRGLDLQGGMHLALELDQSKQVSADPKNDLDLALTVLRKRIDEFGVEEPLVQKVGDNRIVVELAGITDPARAKAIVQRSAFLEFKITDETGALEKALPAMDRTLREPGYQGRGTAGDSPPRCSSCWAVTPHAGRRERQRRPDKSTAKGKGDTAARQRRPATPRRCRAGVLSGLIQPAAAGGMPGRVPRARDRVPPGGQSLSICPRWRASCLGVGAALELPRPPASGCSRCASSTRCEDRSIVTGANLVDAQAQLDPLTNGPIVTFELDRAAAASSARRPASTSATTWRSCSTAGCRAGPRLFRAGSGGTARSRWAARRCRKRRTSR